MASARMASSVDRHVSRKPRTLLACKSCRLRKTRCDGLYPRCSHCESCDKTCEYEGPNATSDVLIQKTYLQNLEDRLKSLENEIGAMLSESNDFRLSLTEHEDTSQPSDTVFELPQEEAIHSPDDHWTCYLGPTSVLAFTQHLDYALRNDTHVLLPEKSLADQSQSLTSDGVSIHVAGLLGADTSDVTTEAHPTSPYDLPPLHIAREMLRAYFRNTGALFPILHEESFINACEDMANGISGTIDHAKLALINIMLAIVEIRGDHSRESSPVQADQYSWRASELCAEDTKQRHSLEDVQCFILLAIYQEHRRKLHQAWKHHCQAVKASYSIGLNCIDTSGMPSVEAEMRKRTWYCCVALDGQFSTVLGLPPTIASITTEVPTFHSVENSSDPASDVDTIKAHGLRFFSANVQLTLMASKIIRRLYGQNLDSKHPMQSSDLISDIVDLDKDLRSLEHSLQADLLPASPASRNADQEHQHIRKGRTMITLRLLNLQLLLHRPCLEKRLGERSGGLTYLPMDFLEDVLWSSVESCTRAARDTILMACSFASLRHGPQLLSPWWLSLSYVFDASLVLFGNFVLHTKLAAPSGQSQTATLEDTISLLVKASMAIRMLDANAEDTSKHQILVDKMRDFIASHDQVSVISNLDHPGNTIRISVASASERRRLLMPQQQMEGFATSASLFTEALPSETQNPLPAFSGLFPLSKRPGGEP